MSKDTYNKNMAILKRAFGVALTAATLLTSHMAYAEEGMEEEATEQTPDPASQAGAKMSANEQIYKGSMVLAEKILDKLPRTPYGQRLVGYTNTYNALLSGQTDVNAYAQMQFIDPDRYTAAAALLGEGGKALRYLLGQHSIRLDDDMTNNMSYFMNKALVSGLGYSSFETRPSSWSAWQDPGIIACLAIPSSSYETYKIGTLTHQQRVDFIAAHEAWHCLHSRYHALVIEENDDTIMEQLKQQQSATLENVPDKTLRSLSIRQKRDMFADIGAAGDLILAGNGADVIDHIAHWRGARAQTDYLHLSVAGLVELKRQITAMGPETFRQMGAADREKLYYDITDSYSFTPERLKVMMQLASAKAGDFAKAEQEAKTDPTGAAAGALRIIHGLKASSTLVIPAASTLSVEQQTTLKAEIRDINPRQAMLDEAFRLKGEITPETILHGYVSLMSGLQKQQEDNPANPFYNARMAQFSASLKIILYTTDFLGESLARGTDVETAHSMSRLIEASVHYVPPAPPEPPKAPQAAPAAPSTASHSHSHGAGCDHGANFSPSMKAALEALRKGPAR